MSSETTKAAEWRRLQEGADPRLQESPGRHEYCHLVRLSWYHKNELLLPAPPCQESLP